MARLSNYDRTYSMMQDTYRELNEAREWKNYYAHALRLIAAPVPMDALHEGTFKSIGAVLSERVQIAQRALNGKRLTPKIVEPPEGGSAPGGVLDGDREARAPDKIVCSEVATLGQRLDGKKA